MSARLEVICGPMFSGKTERLVWKVNRAGIAKKHVRILKPAADTRVDDFIAARYIDERGESRTSRRLPATQIYGLLDLRREFNCDYDVIAIDEAQFFPLDMPMRDSLGYFGREVRALLHRRRAENLRIIVSGLDMDRDDEPFGPMPGLLALADSVEKLSGVCMVCSAEWARHSQQLTRDTNQIAIGDLGAYQVRCRKCHEPMDKKS